MPNPHDKPMIVKIQLPLFTNEPIPLAIIYNEDRSFYANYPASAVAELFAEGEVKAFFEVHLEDNPSDAGGQRISIDAVADWQEW